MRITALESFNYPPRKPRKKGDTFEVDEAHGRLLIAGSRPKAVIAAISEDDSSTRSRRQYRRRDLTAEEN